ncbi:RNA pyrophosphohydrolase [Candidatus Roizmanbacteria bacterium CG_4_10_14_0_2_um_filter_36_35]|uniref:RNA pyrophosphohydrolase n=1 Tax=Candidatus Roizmanbacteria bacterium CG_4_10_14_0_2_um_filter_36_35 TaxID=1974822 RepID=A0A2M7UBR0_9BACT|nr:MAG: RNA pyrophosphohydrolase [Candidatus Roizmanbacteria bacterium CG_4_10_14_0_2_um_filter_36_35]
MQVGINYIGVSVSFFCHDGKENFLLHKRSNKCRDEKGRWDFGGGQMKFGEKLEEALLREIKEEYGVEGIIEKQLPAHSLLREENEVKTHWLIISFIIKIDRKKVKNNDPEKIAEIGWFKLDKLPKPLHSGAMYTLREYKIVFKKYL